MSRRPRGISAESGSVLGFELLSDGNAKIGNSSDDVFQVTGTLSVNGGITTSGNNTFGDASTDVHTFTGSIELRGNGADPAIRVKDAAGDSNFVVYDSGLVTIRGPSYTTSFQAGSPGKAYLTVGESHSDYNGGTFDGTQVVNGISTYNTYSDTYPRYTRFHGNAGQREDGRKCGLGFPRQNAVSLIANHTSRLTATEAGIEVDGSAQMENVASSPSTPTDSALLYAMSGEMYVKDASGNETQISPHDENGEWQYFSRNTKTGKVVRIKMEKLVRKIEELTGEKFIEEE